jgi:hypothetical protein
MAAKYGCSGRHAISCTWIIAASIYSSISRHPIFSALLLDLSFTPYARRLYGKTCRKECLETSKIPFYPISPGLIRLIVSSLPYMSTDNFSIESEGLISMTMKLSLTLHSDPPKPRIADCSTVTAKWCTDADLLRTSQSKSHREPIPNAFLDILKTRETELCTKEADLPSKKAHLIYTIAFKTASEKAGGQTIRVTGKAARAHEAYSKPESNNPSTGQGGQGTRRRKTAVFRTIISICRKAAKIYRLQIRVQIPLSNQ